MTQEADDRSEYYKRYYEDKKGDINARRKQRYDEDPDYRDRVLAASQKYREAQRVDNPRPRIKIPKYAQPLVKTTPDGGEVRLFSVGACARALKRSVQSISHWESKGVLPSTPYRDGRGHRYYTYEMITAIRDVIGDRSRVLERYGFLETIQERWEELGVPMGADSMDEAISRTSA